MAKFLCAMVLVLGLFLVNCTPPPPLANDTGKAKLVVLFPQQPAPSASATPVFINSRQITVLQAGTYCELQESDGGYSVSAGTASPDQAGPIPQKIDVMLSAGATNYVEFVCKAEFKDGVSVMTITPMNISAEDAVNKISKLKKVQ